MFRFVFVKVLKPHQYRCLAVDGRGLPFRLDVLDPGVQQSYLRSNGLVFVQSIHVVNLRYLLDVHALYLAAERCLTTVELLYYFVHPVNHLLLSHRIPQLLSLPLRTEPMTTV